MARHRDDMVIGAPYELTCAMVETALERDNDDLIIDMSF